ncbi:unnamed protein product [Rhizophagus irregularis]|nr:unnamed protein product [Rhizophagus irregularis]
MSAYSEDVLISKLNKLVDTQESISLLSQWFMYHRRHVATSVDIWNRELRKASSARKVSFIYLCNDVCQNSRRKGPEFIREFRTNSPQLGSSNAKRAIDKQIKTSIPTTPPPGRFRYMTTTHNIVESESIIQEYGRKVTKLWTEVMEAEA